MNLKSAKKMSQCANNVGFVLIFCPGESLSWIHITIHPYACLYTHMLGYKSAAGCLVLLPQDTLCPRSYLPNKLKTALISFVPSDTLFDLFTQDTTSRLLQYILFYLHVLLELWYHYAFATYIFTHNSIHLMDFIHLHMFI